jgi:tetratricopeptide (TPR) repeat protein
MMPSGPPRLFLCSSCLAAVLVTAALAAPCPAGAAEEHGRNIVIIDSASNPSWKILWDQARDYARQKKYSAAAKAYAELLRSKGQIEQVKWEYSKVLVELNDWLTASELLDSLLESDGDRVEYLQLAGRVALKNKEFKRAAEYYRKVYDADPAGPSSIEAIKGLIAGLQGLDQKRTAFPLMEQLYQRTPRDRQLLQDLAGYAHEFGDLEKAREYYTTLVAEFNADDGTLMRASSAFEVPGAEKEALTIWEKYLEKQPAYLPFHKKIADYYILIGKSQSALPHILYMIDNGVEDDELLLVAGRILLNDEGRPDRALHYFELYAEKHPEDIAIGIEIKKIQTVLADDFISIVENDGAWMLWRDLIQVTPNREAIYLAMAEKLEKHGKLKDLLKVLLIIHHHHPDDEANIFRVAEVHQKQNNLEDSLAFLKKIKGKSASTCDYLFLRAKIEERLGQELEALQHYTSCLQIKPENQEIRLKSIRLAGRLGLVDTMKEVYRSASGDSQGEKGSAISFAYIEGLRDNALYDETEEVYVKLLRRAGAAPEKEKVFLHKAATLALSRQYFQAEQVLREILARNIHAEQALLRLARLAVEGRDLPRARKWFAILVKKSGGKDWRSCSDRLGRDMYRLHIDILMAEESFDKITEDLQGTLDSLQKRVLDKETKAFVMDMQIIGCRVLLHQKKYEQCLRQLTRLREQQPRRIELAVLWFQLSKQKGRSATAFSEIDQLLTSSGRLSLSRTLHAARVEREYGELAAGLHHLDKILKVVPDSVKVRILKAEFLEESGKLPESLQIYRNVAAQVGEQQYLQQQILELEFKLGNIAQVVKESSEEVRPEEKGKEESVGKRSPVTQDYWRKLLLARALWTDRQWDAALEVYELLLHDPVQEEFQSALSEEKVEVFLPPLKKSIWNMFSSSSPVARDPMAHYMEPEFVGHHLGQPIDSITARMYEKYRWQRLIRNEYLAKKAERNQDIKGAEKQYRQLVQDDVSVEGLYDLARIYGRLGEYGKEAELYQVIRKYGPAYPELSEAIRRNDILRKPRLAADFEVVEKEGRGGFIDTLRNSQGSSYWFMPGLSREASVEYKRNTYTDSKDLETLRGHRFVGAFSQNLFTSTDLFLRMGAESLDQADTTALAGVEVNRRLDDYLKGYISFDQDRVYDTLAALESGVYAQDYEVGLIAETPGGVVLGSEYRRRRYSDDNSQNHVHLWSAYHIYAETTTFKLQYNYKAIDSSVANPPSLADLESADFPAGPFYWSPGSYQEHLGTVSFQHLLKTYSLTKGTPSYYALDYSVGYETGQNISHKAGFEIFLELTSHFLLKGNLTYTTSPEYEQKGALVSLIYRW